MQFHGLIQAIIHVAHHLTVCEGLFVGHRVVGLSLSLAAFRANRNEIILIFHGLLLIFLARRVRRIVRIII